MTPTLSVTPTHPIVIYDSGVGGLTVARELAARRPGLDLVYVADNDWFPYGDKPDLALRARVYAVLDAIVREVRPQAVVIACNTASTAIALALEEIAGEVPAFCVIPPVEAAVRACPGGNVALLATPGTTHRRLVRLAVARYAQPSRTRIRMVPAMPLVYLAERKLAGQAVTADDVAAALEPVLPAPERAEMTGVILGCTHFPWLLDELRPAFPCAWAWSDPAVETADRVLQAVDPAPSDPARVGQRSLVLTSDHNQAQLRPVFARQGFWMQRHVPLRWSDYVPALQAS